jgi:hypothetical protein
MNSTHRSTIRFLIVTTIGAVMAALNGLRWMHSTRPNATIEARIWLALCAFSVILGIVRFLYYRTRHNYFGEEMARRHSLANGRLKAKS